MRAILDVNVLVSAVLSPAGRSAALVLRWLGGEFELVTSDLMGPLPKTARDKLYILVFVDHFTKWAEIIAIKDSSALVLAQHFMQFVYRHGVPLVDPGMAEGEGTGKSRCTPRPRCGHLDSPQTK